MQIYEHVRTADTVLLRDRVLTLPTLEKKLQTLEAEIQTAEGALGALLTQYEHESRDVKRLQDETFSAFIAHMIGRYDSKLEKERREELAAKTAYDRAAARLDGLRRDRDELAARITTLQADKISYEAGLQLLRAEIEQDLSSERGEEYVKLRNERAALISQRTEIDEALKALARARETAGKTLRSLEQAGDWANFDSFLGGGMFTDMVKYEHVDEAEANFSLLSSDLAALRTELRDVNGIPFPRLEEIDSVDRSIDFFFDNIFTDISVRNTILNNEEKVQELLENLNGTEGALNQRLKENEEELSRNGESEEAMLLT